MIITIYAARHFCGYFFLNFCLFVSLIVSCMMFLNSDYLLSCSSVSSIIGSLIVLASTYALPLALIVATVMLVRVEACHKNYWFMNALPNIHVSLFLSLLGITLFFSFCSSILIFDLVPRHYAYLKQKLMLSIVDRLKTMEIKSPQQIIPGYMVMCDNKVVDHDTIKFDNLVVAHFEDGAYQYCLCCQQAYLDCGQLTGNHGTLAVKRQEQTSFAITSFVDMKISIDDQCESLTRGSVKEQPRFLSWGNLLSKSFFGSYYFSEFHRRVSFVIWMLCIPFIALFGVYRSYNLNATIASYGVAGVLFFIMYFSLALLSQCTTYWPAVLGVAYGIPVGMFILSYCWYITRAATW